MLDRTIARKKKNHIMSLQLIGVAEAFRESLAVTGYIRLLIITGQYCCYERQRILK